MASFTSILAFSCPNSLHALPTPTPHCPTLPQPLAIYQSLFCSWDKEDEERDSSNLTAEMKIWEEHVSWESPEKPCLWCLTAPPPVLVAHGRLPTTLCLAFSTSADTLPSRSSLLFPFNASIPSTSMALLSQSPHPDIQGWFKCHLLPEKAQTKKKL